MTTTISHIYTSWSTEPFCDWRLSVRGCVDEHFFQAVYITNAVLSGVSSAIGIGVLINRVVKGHFIWDLRRQRRGLLRPKPLECRLLFMNIFNVFRFIFSFIILYDVLPSYAWRSVFFEFPWMMAQVGITLYFLGVASTVPEVCRFDMAIPEARIDQSFSKWLPTPTQVDTLGFILLIAPFFTNTLIALVSGIVADRTPPNVPQVVAAHLITAQYVCWSFWEFVVMGGIIYFGYKLNWIIQQQLQDDPTDIGETWRIEKKRTLRVGLLRIRILLILTAVILLFYGAGMLVFAIIRENILSHMVASKVISVLYNLAVPLQTIITVTTLAIKPTPLPHDKKQDSSGSAYPSSRSGHGDDGVRSSLQQDNDFELQGRHYPQFHHRDAIERGLTLAGLNDDEGTGFYHLGSRPSQTRFMKPNPSSQGNHFAASRRRDMDEKHADGTSPLCRTPTPSSRESAGVGSWGASTNSALQNVPEKRSMSP
ncbi:hypothetical protein BZG36_00311 [Bifiguratus adelaidae]|uniref:Uncharacterized protein n=1 Tax=Bifiguratus adelaidae TaxID=1938954 RepID=A0A261Y7L4_9FUNG|nr:hypothetical protein BZG36_00311 [Bifiguratus adelaidae]